MSSRTTGVRVALLIAAVATHGMAARPARGVGVQLDPIEGEAIAAADRDLLPSGRHLGYVADVWLANVMSLQVNDGGGVALFDPQQSSSHGRSWKQVHFLLNGFDITDPARPGLPLLEVPHDAWDTLRHRSLWSTTPGFTWDFAPAPRLAVRGMLDHGRDIGGGLWLPYRLMDREPAIRGTPASYRRALRSASEARADVTYRADGVGGERVGDAAGAADSASASASVAWRLHAEHLEHERDYPTLLNAAGDRIPDDAARTTVLATSRGHLAQSRVAATLAWQGTRRSHDGAQWRFPEAMTERLRAHALAAQMSGTQRLGARAQLDLGVAYGYRTDDANRRGDQPLTRDLEGEWLWLARPTPTAALSRQRVDWHARLRPWGETLPVVFSLTGAHAGLRSTPRLGDDPRIGITLLRGAAGDPGDQAVAQIVYEPARPSREWVSGTRAEASYAGELAHAIHLRGVAALDQAAVGTPGRTRAQHWSPAAGVAVTKHFGEHEAFLLVRTEPDAMTAEVASFLDPERPSGTRHAWDDDGDLIPEVGETGRVLGVTGGRYHLADAHLKRPHSRHFAFGWGSPRFGPFRAKLIGVGRWLIDRYDVRLADDSLYAAQPLRDPGGDGRGEIRAEGGGQALTAYARAAGGEADERYVLTNVARADFYLGLEAQALTVERRWWFVNLSAATYLSQGAAPFGNFQDRNDPGVIDEASADPNHRELARGRYDHDRSFAGNLVTGVGPWAGFDAAMALRYRDGQPFTRVIVAADLPQGPTALMALPRGKPRHTFHMTLDVRLRYCMPIATWRATLALDLFNLLGSGTEILEDPRTGATYRDVVETVPGRAGLLTLALAWEP